MTNRSLRSMATDEGTTSDLGDIPELPLARRLVVSFVHRLLAFIHWTIRVEFICEPGASISSTLFDQPCIIVMWHGEQLAIPFIISRLRAEHPAKALPLVPLVSKHADGRLIAHLLYILGFRSVGGSSGKGGTEGLRRLVRAMRAGAIAAITVDGPRGPRYEVKPGAIKLAQITKTPLMGIIATSSWCYRFKSWDRMFFPLPFSRIKIYFLSPRYIGPDDDAEEAMQSLREAMLRYHNRQP